MNDKLIVNNEEISVNYKKIQKMAFIYQALENGWTIKKIDENKYECTKNGSSRIENTNFLHNHMKTKEILK